MCAHLVVMLSSFWRRSIANHLKVAEKYSTHFAAIVARNTSTNAAKIKQTKEKNDFF